MAKKIIEKIIQKFIPDTEVITRHKSLQFLGSKLHEPNLWHLNRRSVSMAFAVGLFCAWVPTPGQMAISATVAFYFSANLPISIVLVWITNPLTMPPLFYFAYRVGLNVMNQLPAEGFEFSVSSVLSGLGDVWQPFLLGCFIMGVISSTVGYVGIRTFWMFYVKSKWLTRHREKRLHIDNPKIFHANVWRKV